ncbi:phage protein GemA/Gp16 family protein [Magnetococcus sp. PR-3]|uniref:phage protein GemA/Gp16 family protein n=1 Tax=Magnetococcus sp. PR-3 TaxID=3120355 RepID=UPI002FCDFC4D
MNDWHTLNKRARAIVKELAMRDDQRRAHCQALAGQGTYKGLTVEQMQAIVEDLQRDLEARISTGTGHSTPRRPPEPDPKKEPGRAERYRFISGCLKELGKTKAYADATAKQLFYRQQKNVVVRIESLTLAQTQKLAVALGKQRDRQRQQNQ